MTLDELMKEVDEQPERQRKEFKEIITLSTLGGDILPNMKEHLEKANTLREFLHYMYEDDNCRYEKAWALWVKMANLPWYERFVPEFVNEDVVIEHGGAVVECGESMILIPVRGIRGRDRTIDIYVYPDDGFNVDVAEYLGSISGKFTCYELPLEGTFDIYRSGKALVFERWTFDELGGRRERPSRKGACPCKV